MSAEERRRLVVEVMPGGEPEVGRWLWALEDTRSRTLEVLDGIGRAALDWTPADETDSIGAVLYHIAAIEIDWLYAEVLEGHPWPQEVETLFGTDVRDKQGRLSAVQGVPLEDHLRRLDFARDRLLQVYRTMSLADFRRPRSLPRYDVTPEWVLHHLMQHEAEHRGQLAALRAGAERALRDGGVG